VIFIELTGKEPFDPREWVQMCAEEECSALFADEGVFPEYFFDLSSGAAGEILHRLSIYRVKLAVVVPDLARYSEHFQAFAREANRGNEIRFFFSREEALAWLTDN
jgi:hypothetical protein